MRETILFSSGECDLGLVLVGRSESGVCAILLADDMAALERELRRQLPQAELREAGTELRALLETVTAFIAAPAAGLDVRLDLRGNDFQQTVWKALQEIPAGSTRSYGEVARRIGAAGSAREVGEACAANALAVAIPCHRVLRKDGALAGYRWGVRRKRALLELERS